jgi:serine/threonine protein kinase
VPYSLFLIGCLGSWVINARFFFFWSCITQHISHPNITPLLAHLSTASHHILVLPYLPGGDLLGLVNNDVAWGKLSECFGFSPFFLELTVLFFV